MKKGKIKINKINIILFVLLSIVVITVCCLSIKKEEVSDPILYSDVSYEIPKGSYCSCLTFYSNNKFSEYDCDSEPSNMPFSGEFYEEYVYDSNKKIITFKSNLKRFKDIKAEVIEWNEEKLVIKVKNSIRSNKKCAIDGKNTYEYVVSSR